MVELKTRPMGKNVADFIESVQAESRRADCMRLLTMMEEVTGARPKLWGNGIVGSGEYHYKYASGREGDWMMTGFSPRKQHLVIYIMPGFSSFEKTMKELGKYSIGKSCLYLKALDGVNFSELKNLVRQSFN